MLELLLLNLRFSCPPAVRSKRDVFKALFVEVRCA